VQVAIAQINEQIGAAGVINHECKQVVAGYGLEMVELLKAQVRAISTMLLRNGCTLFLLSESRK
jgi:phytepsin